MERQQNSEETHRFQVMIQKVQYSRMSRRTSKSLTARLTALRARAKAVHMQASFVKKEAEVMVEEAVSLALKTKMHSLLKKYYVATASTMRSTICGSCRQS